MKLPKFETALALTIGLGLILPVLINLISRIFFADNLRIENVLFHSILELAGAIVSLLLTGILIFKTKKISLARVWLICAFMGMGILDFMHAFTNPDNNFVWLHSLAVFFGGLFFSLICMPNIKIMRNGKSQFGIIICIVFLITFGIGLLSLLYPSIAPLMVANGNFTAAANSLNISGGLLFFIGMFFLINEYSKINKWGTLILAILCALFGAAGILFPFSALWDINWWSWHILRVGAYIFSIICIAREYVQASIFGEK